MKQKKFAVMSTFVAIVLDRRRLKIKTNSYPVKLRVTYERRSRYYQTNYDLTEDAYANLRSSRLKEEHRAIRDSLKDLERDAEKFIRELEPFSFSEFEKEFILHNSSFRQRKAIKESLLQLHFECDLNAYKDKFPIFKNASPPPGTILTVFLSYIDRLLREHRIATATHYQTAYNTLVRFRGNVLFTDITVTYLKEFEVWMLNQEYSITTVGIYTRCLRAMFNEAAFLGIIKKDKCYPFGRRKYRLPMSRNIKKALSLTEVEKIYNYEPTCNQEKWAKDFWLFSYFGNGINTKDIIHLKWKNVDEDFLVFIRAKTENATRDNTMPISVFINEDMKRIIKDWGSNSEDKEDYIFPVLERGITALRQYELLGLFVRSINDWMVKIRKKLGIQRSVTTYVARHTFSTVLKRAGVSTEFIREALGHTSIQTTESYLDSFEKEVKKEFAAKLLAFKQPDKVLKKAGRLF